MRRQPDRRRAWVIYILKCADGSLYTGATNDLAARLRRHQSGAGARYTRSRLPVRCVYREACRGHGAALKKEHAVKKLTRAGKLALIAGKRRTASVPTGRRASTPRRHLPKRKDRRCHSST